MFLFSEADIRTLRAASTLARELLVSTFVMQGADYDSAELRVDRLLDALADVGNGLADLPPDAQTALVEEVARAFDRLSAVPGTAEAAARAARASANLPLGWGKETKQAALGIGLALTLFAKVTGTGFDYSPQSGLSISSPAGLAPGIESTIAQVAKTVSETMKDLTDNAGKRSLPLKTEGVKVRSPRQTRTDLVPAGARERIIAGPNDESYLIERRDAQDVARILRESLGEGYDLPYRDRESAADLYWRRNQKVIEWGRSHSYSLDTGIYPVQLKDGRIVYRISAQIQTPTNVKNPAINELRRRLKAITHGLVSVRTVTREVMLLNSDAPVPPAWKRLAPGLGGPLAVRDSVRGSIGLFVRSAEDNAYLLTAGHVLSGFETNRPIGQDVFSPPLEGDESGRGRIGTVHDFSEFTQSCRALGFSSEVDIGAVKLELGEVPGSDKRLNIDGYQLKREVAELNQAHFASPIYKGPSKTKRARATLRAFDVAVEMTNPVTMRCVRGDGLIQATLDRKAPAESGESGCLVYDADNRPMGLVVAGSEAMGVPGTRDGTTRPVIYIQPLAAYLREKGWSPF